MKKFSRLTALLIIIIMLATLSVSCKKDGGDELDEVIDNSGPSESLGTGLGSTDDTEQQSQTDKPDSKPENNGGADKNEQQGSTKPSGSTGPVKEQADANVKVDENNSVIETDTDQTVDENFHINEAITNDNGFVPDEEQGLEKSERRADEASKYNFDKNPLINRDRQSNKEVLPSFEIDDTGFVRAGTKLGDLKGKTIAFYTSDNYAAWSYRDKKGATIDEWKWFTQLKETLGLSIKATKSSHIQTAEKCLKDMNAGKQMDIVYSSHVTYPASLCISRSITDFVNINSIGSSPGICKRTMDLCKWGNTLRVIAPIGVVDVLWYNQTLTQELGLSDPHKMWEADKWDWAAYAKFLRSVPEKTLDGKNLVANVHYSGNASYLWPATTGTPAIYVDADAPVPTLRNNWDAASTLRCFEFICTLHNETGYVGKGSGTDEYFAIYEGTTLMTGTMRTQVYRDTEYSKHIQINWVPYPMEKARSFAEMEQVLNDKYGKDGVKPATTHDGSAQFCGFAMLLPKKTIKENLVPHVLKFMELWATRFTETYFDNLNVFEYYNFNYLQRKQYFDFVTQRTTFGLSMNGWRGGNIEWEPFDKCWYGVAGQNVVTEAQKISNQVANFIVDALKYGQ